VVVRISAKAMTPDQLDAAMAELIAGIGWPEDVPEAPAAVPIAACAQPLAYDRSARMRKPDAADGIMGSSLFLIGDTVPGIGMPADPALFCRDLPGEPGYSVYRAPDASDAYVIAVGDSGVAVRILPELDAKKHGSMVIAGLVDRSAVFPPFDKFPHPTDVMAALRTSAPLAEVSPDGKTISIIMPAN
jgi:hypothetical protein